MYCRGLIFGLVSVIVCCYGQGQGKGQGQGQGRGRPDVGTREGQMAYLKAFAHMGPENRTDEEAFRQGIKSFQNMAGIPMTGVVDALTMVYMNYSRCGVKDIISMGDSARRRRKRYTAQGSKWNSNQLTYAIEQYPADGDLSPQEVDYEVRRAFNLWSDVTPLTFVAVSPRQSHDINIRFTPRSHDDGNDFDGPGGVLAHAFYPRFGGDVHMDEDETWTKDSSAGTNFFENVAHEFGHSLGLSHSNVPEALMTPFYVGYQPNLMLNQDDIDGIQSIYGRVIPRQTTTTMAPGSCSVGGTGETGASFCTNGRVDAMVTLQDRAVYAFSGPYYALLNSQGIERGYPRFLGAGWEGLEGKSNIDAAVSIDARYAWAYNSQQRRWVYMPERVYIFRGSQVWLYHNSNYENAHCKRTLAAGYPRSIGQTFPGLPDNIDSAFVWGGNITLYFTKDEQYYRYSFGSVVLSGDEYVEKAGSVDELYPRPLATWSGLPRAVDAAMKYADGRTYFFAGGQFYKFNDNQFAVDRANPSYPRPTARWWFGCKACSQFHVVTSEEEDVTTMPSWEDETCGQPLTTPPLSLALVAVISAVLLN